MNNKLPSTSWRREAGDFWGTWILDDGVVIAKAGHMLTVYRRRAFPLGSNVHQSVRPVMITRSWSAAISKQSDVASRGIPYPERTLPSYVCPT
jgi:hypothetical protein